MKKFLVTILFVSLTFLNFSFAKGFKFKLYKPSYKSQSTLKHGNEPVSKKYDTTRLKQKNTKKVFQYKNTAVQNKPSFLSNPIFKWLIGGMIFGAILSFLMGYGLHIGMPGLLEIILITGLIYLLYKIFSSQKNKEYANG